MPVINNSGNIVKLEYLQSTYNMIYHTCMCAQLILTSLLSTIITPISQVDKVRLKSG